MTTFQDTLLVTLKFINKQANSAIDRTTKKLAMLQKRTALATKLSGLSLSLNKSKGIIDSITRKAATQNQIMNRMVGKTNKLNVLNKLGIRDASIRNKSRFFSQKLIDDTTKSIKKQTLQGINVMDKLNDKAKQVAQQGIRKLRTNMLGFGLSALFTGMAIKRLGDAIIKSLVKTYLMATDEQSKFNQQLIAVQASFEFLKFSIVDALSQSDLVIGFIEGLIQLTNRISEFVSKHPLVAKLIGLFSVTAIVGGGLLMVIGQTTLGILGLIAGFELFKDAMIAVKGLGIVKWLKTLKVASWASLGPYIIFPALLLLAVLAFKKLKDITGSWGNAFKAVGIFILAILAFIGDAIIETLLLPIRAVVAILNLLIKGFNALARTKFGRKHGLVEVEEIRQLPAFTLSKRVFEMRNQLLREVETEKLAREKDAEREAALGGVNIIVNGDVTDAHLMDRIKQGIDERVEELKTEVGVPIES